MIALAMLNSVMIMLIAAIVGVLIPQVLAAKKDIRALKDIRKDELWQKELGDLLRKLK